MVGRLTAGALVASALLVAALEPRPRGEVFLALGNMAVVAVASWRLGSMGRWATVVLAAAAWSAAKAEAGWALPSAAELGQAAMRLALLGSLAVTVGTFRHASRRLLRAEDRLAVTLLRERDSARRDRLTRLWNARYLHEALDREIARCRRYGRPFGLLVLDLDGFKAVNDSGGHEAGDHVLQVVGRALRESCRTTDVPARLGGDEFAVILPEASSLTVPRYAARVVEQVARAPFPPHLPRVTASVGAVAFERPPASTRAALAVADEAMYAAKREGKNRFAVLRRPETVA
jgi:diguanylate cyclase (GGDEF)-like protein